MTQVWIPCLLVIHESWFNVNLLPGIWITIKCWLLIGGHNSTWNFDPGPKFNTDSWPVFISSTCGFATQKVSKFNSVIISTAEEGRNATKNPLNISNIEIFFSIFEILKNISGSLFNGGLTFISHRCCTADLPPCRPSPGKSATLQTFQPEDLQHCRPPPPPHRKICIIVDLTPRGKIYNIADLPPLIVDLPPLLSSSLFSFSDVEKKGV